MYSLIGRFTSIYLRMENLSKYLTQIRVPDNQSHVYKDECVYSYDTPVSFYNPIIMSMLQLPFFCCTFLSLHELNFFCYASVDSCWLYIVHKFNDFAIIRPDVEVMFTIAKCFVVIGNRYRSVCQSDYIFGLRKGICGRLLEGYRKCRIFAFKTREEGGTF